MHLFRSEEAAAQWCVEQGSSPGAILSLAQVWTLSELWYGNRMDPDYTGRSSEEAEAVFAQVGLTGAFWCAEDDT